jgi:predicted transposase YdaD
MLNFFRFAEKKFREEGLREGMKEGMKEGIREGIVEVIFRQLKKKFGDVPQDYRLKIRSLDKESLTELSENILDINSLDDIDKFLNLKH